MRVGVFDSGLGGLTVVSSIQKIFKGAELFYIADTLYAPYGEKTVEQIANRCDAITTYLLEKHKIEVLVVACNTATSAAIKHLRAKFPFLIIVGTEPGVKPAINNTKTLKVGIMATQATLRGDKYQFLVNELASEKKVELFECACVGLVDQIEKGEIDSFKTYEMLENWLKPMKQNSVDTIVLGCTHYPLIEKIIKKIMGQDIVLIQTGDAIAKRVLRLTQEQGHVNSGNLNIYVYYTGVINLNMIEMILGKDNIEIRKSEI